MDRKRSHYQRQYENFIYNLEQDAAEVNLVDWLAQFFPNSYPLQIIGLYEKILKEKFVPGRLGSLNGIWDKRGYQVEFRDAEINAILEVSGENSETTQGY